MGGGRASAIVGYPTEGTPLTAAAVAGRVGAWLTRSARIGGTDGTTPTTHPTYGEREEPITLAGIKDATPEDLARAIMRPIKGLTPE